MLDTPDPWLTPTQSKSAADSCVCLQNSSPSSSSLGRHPIIVMSASSVSAAMTTSLSPLCASVDHTPRPLLPRPLKPISTVPSAALLRRGASKEKMGDRGICELRERERR
ncbi:hypothetical protein Dimus_033081, partial [Dionaea muscipula]